MKYLITGGSGYLGTRLTEELAGRDDTELIVNFDVAAPKSQIPKVEFVKGDIRDRTAVRGLLDTHGIDCLVHLAFIFSWPMHDEAEMYDINVNGTQAVLWAATEAGTQHLLVTSSASAYGAWPDNPVPIAEDWPVRGQPDFNYPRHKAEIDRICQIWERDHPDRVMTIVRPTIVFGPHVDNFISQQIESFPVLLLFDGVDPDVQFVHEDDVTNALVKLLDARLGGAFNVASEDTVKSSELAAHLGKRTRKVSYTRAHRLFGFLWRIHAPRVTAPPGALAFSRWPWVVSVEKLEAATGWKPRYSSRETVEIAMRAKGKIPADAPAAEPSTARF